MPEKPDKFLLRYNLVDPDGKVLYINMPYHTAKYLIEHALEQHLTTLKMVPKEIT
jgi:hypothetical protein